jgi:hypothetical protein
MLTRKARAAGTPSFRGEARHLKARLLKPFLEAPEAIPQKLPGHGVMGLKLHRNTIPRKLEANFQRSKLSGIQRNARGQLSCRGLRHHSLGQLGGELFAQLRCFPLHARRGARKRHQI